MYYDFDVERERTIANHFPLVKSIAGKISARTPSSVTYDELISDGSLGLIDAVDRYDPTKGVHLNTYAAFRIKGAILDGLRNLDWYSRSIRKKIQGIEEARTIVESRVSRPAEDWEIAEQMGISLEHYLKICSTIYDISLLNLDDFIKDGHNDSITKKTFGQCRVESDDDPVQNVIANETKLYLAAAMENLPEIQQKVVSFYYYDDLTLKEIGDILNLTESRICQIHGKALIALQNLLKNPRTLKGEVDKMDSDRSFNNGKVVNTLGINPQTTTKLRESEILYISDLQNLTSGNFARKFHHHTVRAVVRRMLQKNIFFSDGESATKSLMDVTLPIDKTVRKKTEAAPTPQAELVMPVSSNGNALAQLTASSMAGAISEFIRTGNAVVEGIEATITLSANHQRYKLNMSLTPEK